MVAGHPKIAFLVYKPWRKPRRKNDSWDNLSQLGAYMLIDVLKRAGIDVGFCSAKSAHRYDTVLVSLTSVYDVLAFAREVFPLKEWKHRKFKVVAGGFGAQNPYPIQEYVDCVWFGRAENEIVWLVENNFDVDHPSLLKLPHWKVCKMNQSDAPYPHPFKLNTSVHISDTMTESIMGCPNKCYYCHYTWVRKYIPTSKTGHYEINMYRNSQELDMFNIDIYDPRVTRVAVGLDGFSERLRYIVNRRVSNEQVKRFIEEVSCRSQNKGLAVMIKMLNITGYETETDDDYKEFVSILDGPLNLQKRTLIVVHNTPLHPSICTPSAYAGLNMFIDTRKYNGRPIVDKPKINAFYSHYQEGPYALLESLVVERAQASTQDIFLNVVFNKKLQALKGEDRIKALGQKYDITPLYREYSVDEPLPSWFIEGYVPQDAIRKMRLTMLRRQGRIVKTTSNEIQQGDDKNHH